MMATSCVNQVLFVCSLLLPCGLSVLHSAGKSLHSFFFSSLPFFSTFLSPFLSPYHLMLKTWCGCLLASTQLILYQSFLSILNFFLALVCTQFRHKIFRTPFFNFLFVLFALFSIRLFAANLILSFFFSLSLRFFIQIHSIFSVPSCYVLFIF